MANEITYNPTIRMNHSEYMRNLKDKSIAELQFIINDARKAEEAMPYGPKAGYYADEQHYAAMELKSRKKETIAEVRALLSGGKK